MKSRVEIIGLDKVPKEFRASFMIGFIKAVSTIGVMMEGHETNEELVDHLRDILAVIGEFERLHEEGTPKGSA